MESGEEQHFLRGKPAFRARALVQAPQTRGDVAKFFTPVLLIIMCVCVRQKDIERAREGEGERVCVWVCLR